MSIKDLSCFSVISTNVFHDIENNIIKKSYQTNVEIGMSTEQIKGLIDDYIKKLQVAGISIPRVKDSYLENKKIFYNTDYCGENIIESGISINNFNDFHSKINKIAEILKIAVSNSLYLDPHPKNFVFNELNSIFYVDFYPPYSSYLKSMRLKIAKPDEYSLISENFDFFRDKFLAMHFAGDFLNIDVKFKDVFEQIYTIMIKHDLYEGSLSQFINGAKRIRNIEDERLHRSIFLL